MPKREPAFRPAAIPRDPTTMPYVTVAPGSRYFMTEDGAPFLVIGHNDAMPWPRMRNLRHERDLATTEAYIRMLAEHGVTVLRIMLEYCQHRGWYFERPVGRPLPPAVQYWDNLVGLCERYRVRLLVLFWDTFFLSRRWEYHPYSRPGSGFDGPGSFCTSRRALAAEKERIRFFIDRWGNSPAIFGYDLLNEIHPYWGGTPEEQSAWVTEMARFVKDHELRRWGKRHLVTVSVFGSKPEGGYLDLILRHPELDFATTHVYEFGLVDNPTNTIDGALVMRDAVCFALEHILDGRPFTDSESGPIHLFMDLERQLPEPFEQEYYHNMSWAHLATGGAGSGLRWPFRHPHCLTAGMHAVQRGMARVCAALDWARFCPRPIDRELALVAPGREDDEATAHLRTAIVPFGCADNRQALVWLLRDLRHVSLATPLPAAALRLPPLAPGEYAAEFWDTYAGAKIGATRVLVESAPTAGRPEASGGSQALAAGCGGALLPLPAFERSLAVTLRPRSAGPSA